MPVLFLKQWISGEMIRAISWTLLHSLWQGLIAALIAGIIITCTRKSRALLRYNLLGSVLILFLAITIITLFVGLSDNKAFSAGALLPATDSNLISSYTAATNDQNTKPVAGYIDQFINFLNNNAALVILIWLIFFFAKCVKMMAGLLYINKIRATGIHNPADEWNKKILQLSELLGLRQTIRLFETELVKVPAAIGVLKPVILVPLGLLANLPAEHVETILLHELSHIRRKDFLVNLFQNVAETIFFFNPALIWISSLIREEREACCDDIVVANTTHKIRYLEALISFQEHYIGSASGYAMALGNRKMHMLNRLNRLITHQNKKLNFMEKIILMSGLVIIMAFNFIPKNEIISKNDIILKKDTNQNNGNTVPDKNIPQNKRDNTVQSKRVSLSQLPGETVSVRHTEKKNKFKQADLHRLIDTVPAPVFKSIKFHPSNDEETKDQMIVAINQSGTRYTITKVNGKVSAMSIDGVSVTDLTLPENIKVLNQIEEAWNEAKLSKHQNLKSEKMGMTEHTLGESSDKFKIAKEKHSNKKDLVYQKQSQLYKTESPKYKPEGKLYKTEAPKYKPEGKLYKTESPKYNPEGKLHKTEAPKYKPEGKLYKEEAPLYKKKGQLYKKENLSDQQEKLSYQKEEIKHKSGGSGSFENNIRGAEGKKAAKEKLERSNRESWARDMERANGIIRDVLKEQIVPDAASIEWFGLTENELIVNGRKLDADLQQKLKTKYNVTQGHGLFYGPVKMSGTGVFLDKKSENTNSVR